MSAPRVTVKHRPASAPMGRFGGGWQWALGFRAGGRTLLVDLFVFSIRVSL